jgi:hypothetical protein
MHNNFDSWYEQLENNHEDERIQRAEEAYLEYMAAIGKAEDQEEAC